MACPSDITITISHHCTSPTPCALDSSSSLTLDGLLARIRLEFGVMDERILDRVEDAINEVIQTQLGL